LLYIAPSKEAPMNAQHRSLTLTVRIQLGFLALAALLAPAGGCIGLVGGEEGDGDGDGERTTLAVPRPAMDDEGGTRPLINDDLKLKLMPWATRGSSASSTGKSNTGAKGYSAFSTTSFADQPAALVPSGLYKSGAVTQITGPVTKDLKVAEDYAWQRSGCGEHKPFRVYEALLETTSGKTRPVAVLIDDAIDSSHDKKVVEQTLRGWAAMPPELRGEGQLPGIWEVNASFVFTVGTICDAYLTKFGYNVVTTGFSSSLYDDNATTGAPGLFGILWHEAAGHMVADSHSSTLTGAVAGEPYMTLYSMRAALGSQAREINSDRMAALIAAMYADKYQSDASAAEPASVARVTLKCGFPKNYKLMSTAFSWLDSYFNVDCSSYQHPVKVVNGHFAASTSVEIYGDSGKLTTCLVNIAGLQASGLATGKGTDLVVAQPLPNGALACSAVCQPNGYVQDIYGLVSGNSRLCIPIGDCFKKTGFKTWYNAIQDFCEFASASADPLTRCLAYFGSDTVVYESSGASGTEVRCISKNRCEQSWSPPKLIGYGLTVQGSSCKK
jgi:hypothetical protein